MFSDEGLVLTDRQVMLANVLRSFAAGVWLFYLKSKSKYDCKVTADQSWKLFDPCLIHTRYTK